MEIVNKDGSITIDEIVFDLPNKESLTSFDHKEWKEGRSNYAQIWMTSYQKIGNAMCRMLYDFQLKNGNIATIDGQRIKNENDIAKIKFIFDLLK